MLSPLSPPLLRTHKQIASLIGLSLSSSPDIWGLHSLFLHILPASLSAPWAHCSHPLKQCSSPPPTGPLAPSFGTTPAPQLPSLFLVLLSHPATSAKVFTGVFQSSLFISFTLLLLLDSESSLYSQCYAHAWMCSKEHNKYWWVIRKSSHSRMGVARKIHSTLIRVQTILHVVCWSHHDVSQRPVTVHTLHPGLVALTSGHLCSHEYLLIIC